MATKSKSVTRREEVQKPTVSIVDPDVITITIGKNKLKLSKEALKARRGVHKAVINTIAPWITKVLNDQI